jgi:hypothetical protein
MSGPIRIHLSAAGVVRDPGLSGAHTKPWNTWDFGEFLSIHYGYLDEYAQQLGVATIGSFIESGDADREPRWYDAAEGLRTFEALATELIARLGTNDSFERIEDALWDVRQFELVLRRACQSGEKFYLAE